MGLVYRAWPAAFFLIVLSGGCGGSDSPASRSRQLASTSAAQADYRPLVQHLYMAYFGRPADPAGEDNFSEALRNLNAPTDIQQLRTGYREDAAVKALIDTFGTSAESQSLYGASDAAAFIASIYSNVLGRAPAAEGLAFWSNAISNGQVSRAGAAIEIMAGALASQTTQGLADAALIRNRVDAASFFTQGIRSQGKTTSYSGNQAAGYVRSVLATIDAGASQDSYQATVLHAISDVSSGNTSFLQFSLAIAGTKKFFVDDETATLAVTTVRKGGELITPRSVSWSSNLQGALPGNSASMSQTLTAGTHVITATVDAGDSGTAKQHLTVRVLPRMSPVTAFQSTPVEGHLYTVPILAVTYIPTQDGITIDESITERQPDYQTGSVTDLQQFVSTTMTRTKFALEEGSKFRGYKNPSAVPSVGYKVVAHYNIYESMKQRSAGHADLIDMMSRISGKSYVEDQGVKEVWLWAHPYAGLNESNMSSPVTGDISNSYREEDDLPRYAKTYIVYGYNYGRTFNEAVHDHGHQFEAQFSYLDYLANENLFWGSFVGHDGSYIHGRCGCTHFTLNSVKDYDYWNLTRNVKSNCEDWHPDGSGATKIVNVRTWGDLVYNWPVEAWPGTTERPNLYEANWYIYWMQNMPGYGNTIPYNNTTMENWWIFVGDWDAAISSGKRLFR